MKRFRNILVATDTRLDEHPIVDQAAEIARQNKATLRIVDVVPESSWIAQKTTPELEAMRELYSQEKKDTLEDLAATIRLDGVDVETTIMSGKTSVEIIREVVRRDHDLVMAVAKGKNSTRDGFFGHTAFQLLRQCPSAVWLVTSGSTIKVKHVLACVDISSEHSSDVELNDKVYELSASIGRQNDAQFSVLHAWLMRDEALLSTRLTAKEVARYVRDERNYKQCLFDKFLAQHESSTDSENVHMTKGLAHEVISAFVRDNSVDLVVMGTVARSGILGMFMGNTAEKILHSIECSVLALKPYNFKTSIR